MAGWLDKLEDGGKFDGLTNKGFNYNGAWGGPVKNGGWLDSLQDGGSTGGANPGVTGFTYARTGAPSNGKYAKKTMPSAQDGLKILDEIYKRKQQGKAYIPKAKIKDEKSQAVKPASTTAVKKKDADSEKRRYLDFERRGGEKGRLERQAAEKKAFIDERKERIAKANANPLNKGFGVLNPENWTPENLAEATAAIGDKFSVSDDPNSTFDTWFNPLKQIGDMASDLGSASLRSKQEEGSWLPYMTAIGTPLVTGAFEGIGTGGSNKKFASNLLNPFNVVPGYETAISAAKPYLKQGMKTAGRDLRKLASDAYKGIDETVVYPLQYRSKIADMKKYIEESKAEFQTLEGRKRLSQVLGIDPDDLQYPHVMSAPGERSYYNPLGNYINIDFRQLGKLKKEGLDLPTRTVMGHEEGHWLQREARRHSPEYQKQWEDYHEALAKYDPVAHEAWKNQDLKNMSTKELNEWFNTRFDKPQEPWAPGSEPTIIDRYASQLYEADPKTGKIPIPDLEELPGTLGDEARIKKSAEYFTEDNTEQLAHFREMRENMIKKGYIKNRYDPISDDMIQEFMEKNPRDRISSFTTPTDKLVEGIGKVFRNLPASVPVATGATAVGTAAALGGGGEQRNGGIVRDDRGYWNPDNWGRPVEIGSNDITMRGVNQDLLGVSDTGDTKLMKPGKNYKFKGNKVTELPISKDGSQLVKLDQLTNFTNYNTKQPGGWLDQFQNGGEIEDPRALIKPIRDVIPTTKKVTETKTKVRLPITKEQLLKAKPKPKVNSALTSAKVAATEAAFPSTPVDPTKMLTEAGKELAVQQQQQLDAKANAQIKQNEARYNSRSNNLDVTANRVDNIIDAENLKSEDDVKKVQQNLVRLGYNLNPSGKFKNNGVDGKLGKVTLAAINEHNEAGGNFEYTPYKKGEGYLGKCTEKHCAEYIQGEVFRNLKPNVTIEEWRDKTGMFGDAWDMGDNIEKAGGRKVPVDAVKGGDVVTIYTGVQTYMKDALKAGTDATHTGIVDKVNEDGSYYILHNVHKETSPKGAKKKTYKGREYRTLVHPDGSLEMGNYKVRNAYAPNYAAVQEFEEKHKTRDDVKLVMDPKYTEKIKSMDKSIGGVVGATAKEYLGVEADKIIGTDMHKKVNTYLAPINDIKTKNTLSGKYNLSETEYQSLGQLALGVLGQEGGFGTSAKAPVKELAAKTARRVGTFIQEKTGRTPDLGKLAKYDEVSKGAGQVKFRTNYGDINLSEFGINESNYTNDDKVPVVVMDILAKGYKENLSKGLSQEDAMYAAVENYNKGRVTKYAGEKDVDYANKVLSVAEAFNPKDKSNKAYNTLIDKLNLNNQLVKNKIAKNIK